MSERVWERYLTEQDRAHIASKPARSKPLGSRPALLLIDLYRAVYGYRPQPILEAIEEWPSSCGLAAWEAIPHIQRLLAAAREADIPVIYSTGMGGTVGPWDNVGGRKRTPSAEEARKRMEGTEIMPEVAPREGEMVFRKAAPSVFWGTPLIGELTQLGIDTLIVGGESTSGCVRAAVTDGFSYGFKMAVVEECVFDRHEAAHAMNLFDMNQKTANVISLAEAIAYLQGCQDSQRGLVVGSSTARSDFQLTAS